MSKTSPIILNASNVAALVNKNPYVSRGEAFLAAWRSSDKESYKDAHARNNEQTVEERRREIQRASPFISATVRAPKPQFMDVMGSQGQHMFQNPQAEDFHSQTSDISNRAVFDEAKRLAFTRYGTEREESILERVRAILPDKDFRTVPGDALMKRQIGVSQNGKRPFILQGKVDGLSKDGSTILECKTRMHKLFLSLRDYEEIQARSYLHILPETTMVILAEAFFGSATTPDINIIHIPRKSANSADDWMTVLHHVAQALAWVLDDPEIQDTVIKSKNRGATIQSLILKSLRNHA
jgi:hypothetical protein